MDEDETKETDQVSSSPAVDQELTGMLASLQAEADPKAVVPTQITAVSAASEPPTGENEIRQLLVDFENIKGEILKNYRSDRDQVESAIKQFENNIKAGVVNRAVIEGFVNSLKIKADINSNAIKILDAQAKLLAAGRGTNIFIQSQGIDPKSLDVLLNAPAYPDELRRKTE